MENMRIYEKVRNVPSEALKPINGGRLKGMSDINPMWRIKMLTETFGICGIGWKVEITDKRLEKGDGVEIVCFVDINLYVKVDGEWSEPIPGMGGSSFVTQEQRGPFTSDECFKMAYTDAISVACKSLGFAADVYFEKDRTKYSQQEDASQDNARQPQRAAQPSREREAPIPSNEDLNAIENASEANRTGQAQQSSGGGAMSRVYALQKKTGISWPALNQLASTVLDREIKFLKTGVKTEEEWQKIENALKEAG